MQTSPDGEKLIQHFESLRLKAYPDYERDRILWTVGWGHTGKDVKQNTVITMEKAEELFRKDLDVFEEAVSRLVKVKLNQAQFDALVSFTYNLGAASLRGSTMLHILNQGKHAEAAAQLIRWIYDDDKIQGGLVKRRYTEQAFFNGSTLQQAIDWGEQQYGNYILRLQTAKNK